MAKRRAMEKAPTDKVEAFAMAGLVWLVPHLDVSAFCTGLPLLFSSVAPSTSAGAVSDAVSFPNRSKSYTYTRDCETCFTR